MAAFDARPLLPPPPGEVTIAVQDMAAGEAQRNLPLRPIAASHAGQHRKIPLHNC
jgi:hypothetical protein